MSTNAGMPIKFDLYYASTYNCLLCLALPSVTLLCAALLAYHSLPYIALVRPAHLVSLWRTIAQYNALQRTMAHYGAL